MKTDPRALLLDIVRAIADIESFVDEMDLDAYLSDARTQAAVERKFEVIGEAIIRIRKHHPNIAERIPQARRIVDFRNVLAHGYDKVVPELVWDYGQGHLQTLRRNVRTLLAELEATGS